MRRLFCKPISHIFLPIVLGVSLYTGIKGVDFGEHWDEDRVLRAVSQSIETGLMLPRWYNYPSLTYDLALLCLVPELFRYHSFLRFSPGAFSIPPSFPAKAIDNVENPAQQKTSSNPQSDPRISGTGHPQGLDCKLSDHTRKEYSLRAAVTSHTFKLRVRIVFLIVSLASCVWVYLLVFLSRGDWLEALLASSVLALSWEVAYHARWIAPDAILMQFGALTIMLLVFSHKLSNYLRAQSWLTLAAASAGLTCGTKYQAGLLMLPVLLAASLRLNPKRISLSLVPWKFLAKIFAIFALCYLATTPGTIVEPYEFIHDVMFEMRHYRSGHWGHTVGAGIEHLGLILIYLSVPAFSTYPVIALMFSIFAGFGVLSLLKEDKTTAAIFLSFPVCYVLYMSLQNVMIVRNLLILFPFMSILAARGAFFVQTNYLKASRVRLAFCVIIISCLVLNAVWLNTAANTIKNRDKKNETKDLAVYIGERPTTEFLVSKGVRQNLLSLGYSIPKNVVGEFATDVMAVFYSSEAEINKTDWPANRWNYYRLLPTGPYEVNFDYYPDWIGYNRVVILPATEARKLKAPLE